MTIIIYVSSFFNLTIFIPAPVYHTKYSYKSHSEFTPAAPAAPHRCGAQAYRQNPPLGSFNKMNNSFVQTPLRRNYGGKVPLQYWHCAFQIAEKSYND